MAICNLAEKDGQPNWCEHHKNYHRGHYAQYAVDPGPKGEIFRKFWDSKNGIQSELKPLLRSIPIANQCIHNTGVNGTTKAGCGKCTTYGCNLKGTVRLSECCYCLDHENPSGEISGVENPKDNFDISTTRNLPVNGDWINSPNVWEIFRAHLAQEMKAFDER